MNEEHNKETIEVDESKELTVVELRFNGDFYTLCLIDISTVRYAMIGLRKKGLNQAILPDAYDKIHNDVHIFQGNHDDNRS